VRRRLRLVRAVHVSRWAVYEASRGRYRARPYDVARDGCVCIAGGTGAESRGRALRLAAGFNDDVDKARADRRTRILTRTTEVPCSTIATS